MKVAAQQKDLDHPRDDNPLGRVLLAFKGDTSRIEEDYEVAELRISEAIVGEIPKTRTVPGVPATGRGGRSVCSD